MSLFASKMPLGSATRNDVTVASMPFTGTKPKPGDVVKVSATGAVEVTTTNADRAYGVVTFFDSDAVCAVVTHGHVIAHLNAPTVGGAAFDILTVVRPIQAVDSSGALSANGYEVKVE